MSFDSIGGANAIKDILAGLSGIGGAQIGVPESIGPRVWGYVTVGSMIILPGTPGSTDRDTHYMATLAYRLDDNEATADDPDGPGRRIPGQAEDRLYAHDRGAHHGRLDRPGR